MEISIEIKLPKDYLTAINSIMPDHERYIKCQEMEGSIICIAKGNPNDLRKTVNEFLESLIFVIDLENLSGNISSKK